MLPGEYDIRYEDTWERHQPLIQRYEDQLIFLGKLESMQAMANFFAACDVLVMPSKSDAFGIVYLEAWYLGKPVIDIFDFPECIGDHEHVGALLDHLPESLYLLVVIHLLTTPAPCSPARLYHSFSSLLPYSYT